MITVKQEDLEARVLALKPGDTIEAVYDDDGDPYVLSGILKENSDGCLYIGETYVRVDTGEPVSNLMEIRNRIPKPQPYAEGTDRTAPQLCDVVIDATGSEGWQWMYLPREGDFDMKPWLEVERDGIHVPANWKLDGRVHRGQLPARLRLIRELRDVDGGS